MDFGFGGGRLCERLKKIACMKGGIAMKKVLLVVGVIFAVLALFFVFSFAA